jgi:hypothetical protein
MWSLSKSQLPNTPYSRLPLVRIVDSNTCQPDQTAAAPGTAPRAAAPAVADPAAAISATVAAAATPPPLLPLRRAVAAIAAAAATVAAVATLPLPLLLAASGVYLPACAAPAQAGGVNDTINCLRAAHQSSA